VGGRKKKQVHEEHENHERWLVSWADFMTLLFAFFVVMYAVSRVDTKKAQTAEQSIRWAMHMGGKGGVTKLQLVDGPPSHGGAIPSTIGGAMSLTEEQLVETVRRRIEKRVRPFVLERPLKGAAAVTVSVDGQRVTVRLAASEFFDAGQAALRPQALPIVDAIAAELVQLGRPLQVEGHTDESPIHGGRFRDNWELSASRAATVVSYLAAAHGAKPALLSASGHADTRPLAVGGDDAARELNRRVELVVELDVREPPRPRSSRPSDAPAAP
jgi:chemotaxis protein MotB